MKHIYLIILFLGFSTILKAQFTLNDFYSDNFILNHKTDSVFYSLTDTQRIAQMIISSAGINGKSDENVQKMLESKIIGGMNLMKDTRENHIKRVKQFNSIAKEQHTIPILYSMDAEPSLINYRIPGSENIKKTSEITDTADCRIETEKINNELNTIGIKHNYAPVCDVSTSNQAITNRSFGDNFNTIITLSNTFINTSQKAGIAATVKHFPGHGLVSGDTHSNSVFIDGELKELPVFKEIINNGVISVMIAHITIINNKELSTNGLPSTCSRKIVTDLLKDSLQFKGLIITDALGMGAASKIENIGLTASMAGCDMLLMPENELELFTSILKEINSNLYYRQQVYESVKKIIRLKICLGLI